MAVEGRYDDMSRTWNHIKVLYTLVILLAAVALALFIVCFMMLLNVQRDIQAEVSLRKERENQFLRDLFVVPEGKAGSQKTEILTNVADNAEPISIGGDVKISATTLTRFCASIHSHCPTRGPPGPQGVPGISQKGDLGPAGARGFTGLPGAQGIPGVKGEKGEIGPPGFGLVGAPGPAGDKGSIGSKGEKGDVGPKGLQGPRGDPGIPGMSIKGEPGKDGTKGSSGLPGIDGVNGIAGAKGDRGEKGETGRAGFKGDSGLPGTPGMPGNPGEQGEQGERGIIGFPGPMGFPGEKGAKGEPGLQGNIGLGTKGEKGEPGLAGNPGADGPSGLPGPTGPAGDDGTPGPPGEPGEKGEAGAQGLEGARGKRGKKGEKGDAGEVIQCECQVGPPGEKGATGEPGSCPRTTPMFMLYQNTSIPEKKRDMRIKRIGKPLLYRQMDTEWGSWMVDSDPTPITKDKYYITLHFTGTTLYEFDSQNRLRDRSSNFSRQYNIQDYYYGTGGAVYRGAFYYHRAGLNIIARYDIESRTVTAQTLIEDSLCRGSASLFKTEYNYYDFSVDENGLWLTYAYKPLPNEPALPNMIVVAKLESNYLDIEKTWNISLMRQEYSNGFVALGILYLLKSGTASSTSIEYAYDLYGMQELTVSIPFTNVYENNRMLAYDYVNRNILAWDSGRIISYLIVEQ